MAYRFVARVVGVEEDPVADSVTAGVAEFEDGSGFALLFMSSVEQADAQDLALGMDTHCVVTAGQGTAYGCVREVVRAGEVLRVTLDPAALEALGLDDAVIEVVLGVPDVEADRMLQALSRILAYGRPDAQPSRVEL